MAAFQTAQIESIKKKPEGDGVPFDDPIPF